MTWRRATHFFYHEVPAIEVRWQASRPTEPSLSIPPLNSLSMSPFCFRCLYSSSFGTVMCVGWCLCHFESYRLSLSCLITLPAIIDSFCCVLLAIVSFMTLIDYGSRGLHILILQVPAPCCPNFKSSLIVSITNSFSSQLPFFQELSVITSSLASSDYFT